MYRKDSELVPVGDNRFAPLSKYYMYATPEELHQMFPKIYVKKSENSDADKVVSPNPKMTNSTNVAKKL
jgi:hypothetical protein